MVRLQSVSSVLLVVRLLKAIMIIQCRPELSESKNIIMHNAQCMHLEICVHVRLDA